MAVNVVSIRIMDAATIWGLTIGGGVVPGAALEVANAQEVPDAWGVLATDTLSSTASADAIVLEDAEKKVEIVCIWPEDIVIGQDNDITHDVFERLQDLDTLVEMWNTKDGDLAPVVLVQELLALQDVVVGADDEDLAWTALEDGIDAFLELLWLIVRGGNDNADVLGGVFGGIADWARLEVAISVATDNGLGVFGHESDRKGRGRGDGQGGGRHSCDVDRLLLVR